MANINENQLKKIEKYINNLNKVVGLRRETIIDINRAVSIQRNNLIPKKSLDKEDDTDNMRSANYNAWWKNHEATVKKCSCEIPEPRATNTNECRNCNSEIYKDSLDKIRWINITKQT
jgi:hypothetical protein